MPHIYAKENKVLQTIMKVLRNNNVLFVNKNKELQNINETEQKQWCCNTYFPWPYLLIYLQHCFYIAFQSSLSLRYHFPLCASRFCASHFVALFLTWGWSQGMGACTTGLATPPWKWRHRPETRSQLIQAPSLSRGMRVDRFLLFTSFKTCMFSLTLLTNVYVY